MEPLGRSLMLFGAILFAAGLLLYFGPALPWLGRLPGDIRVERPGTSFYFPLTTCVLLSLLLSGLAYLWSLFR